MKRLTPLLLALLLCGCSGPERVTLGEFKKHDAELGMPQSMHSVTYLGCRDGRTWSSIASGRTASVFGHPVRSHASPPRIRHWRRRLRARPPKRELAVVIIGKPVRHEFPEPRLRAKVESMELILIEQGFAPVVFQLATATGRSIYPALHHD